MLASVKSFFSNFNKKNREYISCKFLQGGITFMDDSVRACCSNKCGVKYVDNYSGENLDIKKIFKEQKRLIKDCQNGILPENCKNCVHLENKYWDKHNKITEIFINHWNHCNCGCVYCIQGRNGEYLLKEKKPSPFFSVYNHIKELYSRDMVDIERVHVELVGGDIAVLDEAEDIINYCLNKGVYAMSFHSSCLEYSPGIERAFRESPVANMDFSLDCASRELYHRIKRIDAFDVVLENIKRYIRSSEKAKECLIAKYIIIDGLNDTPEELERWLDLMHSIGIKRAKVDVNFNKYFSECNDSRPNVPSVYYEMYFTFYKLIEKYGMEDCCWEFSRRVMKEGGIPAGY